MKLNEWRNLHPPHVHHLHFFGTLEIDLNIDTPVTHLNKTLYWATVSIRDQLRTEGDSLKGRNQRPQKCQKQKMNPKILYMNMLLPLTCCICNSSAFPTRLQSRLRCGRRICGHWQLARLWPGNAVDAISVHWYIQKRHKHWFLKKIQDKPKANPSINLDKEWALNPRLTNVRYKTRHKEETAVW